MLKQKHIFLFLIMIYCSETYAMEFNSKDLVPICLATLIIYASTSLLSYSGMIVFHDYFWPPQIDFAKVFDELASACFHSSKEHYKFYKKIYIKGLKKKDITPNDHHHVIYGTPLCLACTKNDTEFVTILLNYKAHITSNNLHDDLPLETACFNGNENIIKKLLLHGADPNLFSKRNDTCNALFRTTKPSIVELLIQYHVDVNHQYLGESILHAYVKTFSNFYDDPRDHTLYDIICSNAITNSELIADRERMTLLMLTVINAGLNINNKDKEGNTPLHIAVSHNQFDSALDIIPLLLLHGADETIKNNKNQTPIDLAKNSNNENIQNMFTEESLRNIRMPIYKQNNKENLYHLVQNQRHGIKFLPFSQRQKK